MHSDIKATDGWYRFEAKEWVFTVTDAAGDPVDLSTTGLLWRVVRDAGSPTIYLEKTDTGGIAVDGDGNNVVTITIDPDTDYATLEDGIFRHELWDSDTPTLLVWGDCWILSASEPVVTP